MSNQTNQPTENGRKALVVMGEVAAPAGIAGLVCQLLGLTGTWTAAISISVMLFCAAVVFRKAINRMVPSFVSLAIVAALLPAFFFFSESRTPNQSGIVHIERRANDFLGTPLNDLIRSANSRVTFFGTSFHITAGDSSDLLLDALSRGVRIRFLVVNPVDTDLERLARDFDVPNEEIRRQAKTSIVSLYELGQRWDSRSSNVARPGELSIRLFETVPRMRAYLIDNSQGYVVPYINSMNSARTPGLLLDTESGLLEDYTAGIDREWANAISLADFISKNSGYLD